MRVIIDYCTIRTPLRCFAWPTLLSAALLVHFLISVGIWLSWFVDVLRNAHMRDEFVPFLWSSLPAFMLCALSGILFVLALRGRPVARHGAVFLVAVAALFFVIDVYFGRWQIHTFVAMKEYWASGGDAHHYFTWWWFDDRWLR